jgi:hypothetical protein
VETEEGTVKEVGLLQIENAWDSIFWTVAADWKTTSVNSKQ